MATIIRPFLWDWAASSLTGVDTARDAFGKKAAEDIRAMQGVVTATGKKARAAARAANAERFASWRMFVAQGVPLKDPDAVVYFARSWYAAQLRAGSYTDENTLINEARRLAGGVLPTGDVMERLKALHATRVKRSTEKLEHRPVKDPMRAFEQKRIALRQRMQADVERVLRQLGFVSKVGEKHDRLLNVDCGWHGHTNGPIRFHYSARHKGHQTLQCAFTPGWYVKVFKSGRHQIAGPGTLTRSTERTSRGDKVTFYERREKSHILYLREGYLSFRNGTTVVVDIRTLSKVTLKGVEEV